jgi:hypothetical protein
VGFIVFHETLHNRISMIYKILMQEELSPEEKIRNKTITRKKEIEFFSYFFTHPSSNKRLVKLENQGESHENRTWTPLFKKLKWNKMKLQTDVCF